MGFTGPTITLYNLEGFSEQRMGWVGDLLVSANTTSARTAAVGPGAFITGVTPTGYEEQTPDTFITTQPVNVDFLFTEDLLNQIVSSQVQILKNDTVEAVLPAGLTGTRGTAVWAAGSVLDMNAGYLARAIMTLTNGMEVQSPVKPVPVLTFDLSIDGDSTTDDTVAGLEDGVDRSGVYGYR